MANGIKNEKTLFFLGGMAVVALGKKLLKSQKTRELCVNTLAQGMKLQKEAKVALQNLKEEAEDICYEAKQEAGLDEEQKGEERKEDEI